MSKGRRCTTGELRAFAAAFAIAVVGIGASASAAAAVPANFWGVVPQAAPSAEQLQRLRRGAVDSIRIPIVWSAVQLSQGGVPDWAAVDALVGNAATAGVDVLPFIYGSPSWAVPISQSISSKPPKTLPVKTGPQRSAWTAFLKLAVGRYGPNGSFWAENPTVPRRPIRTWQIWNEENFKYFVAQPNPTDYGKLVKISYSAVKSADPGAKIVLGGLFARPNEARPKRKNPPAYFATDFLEQMYKTTPGIKAKFSGVALHPYTGIYQELTPYIEEVRDVLKVNHDAGKGLWITEIGWSSQHPSSDVFAKGVAGQAAQLRGAFGLLRSKQAKWKIQRVYWFSIDDQPAACNFCGGSGLFGPGFVPKKSWFEFVKFSGGSPN
jgi:hypothetical protein